MLLNKKNGVFLISCLMTLLFTSQGSADDDIEIRKKSIRNLISRLNNDYIQLENSFKKLESEIQAFPRTTLNLSVIKREGSIRLASIDAVDRNRPLQGHLYTIAENEALEAGGRHQLYEGEIRQGNHELKIIYYWAEGNAPPRKSEAIIPLAAAAGKSYYLFLEFSREDIIGGVKLSHSILDLDNR